MCDLEQEQDTRIARIWRAAVRDGSWLTWERIRFACLCLAIGLSVSLIYVLSVSNAFRSPNGTYMMDYLSFWLAGSQALQGTPGIVYHPELFQALQLELTKSPKFFAFFYPPIFQVIQMPFGMLPYGAAFLAFVASTAFLLAFACRLITGRWTVAACLIVAPACVNNMLHGQNAALSAALLGIFFVCLEKRQGVLAGLTLGVLTFKPQLGALIPVALIVSLNIRAFLSAAVTTVGLMVLSFPVVGIETWRFFLDQAPFARSIMETGGVEWGKMISVYGALRLLGWSSTAAYFLQGVIGFACLVCVSLTWKKCSDMVALAPVLTGATLLATPFALSYDLALLIIPAAFIIRSGIEGGFLPYEKAVLAAVLSLTGSTSSLALWIGVPVAPLFPALMLILGLRRAFSQAGKTETLLPQGN